MFDNNGPNKYSDNPFEVLFNGGTKLTVVDHPEIRQYSFCFKPITKMVNRKLDFGLLYGKSVIYYLEFLQVSSMYIRILFLDVIGLMFRILYNI
jgi:hypothetical protein